MLTKGPRTNAPAWSEKLEWVQKHLPDVAGVHVGSDKSLVYGRVLVDDFPDYFESWLNVRPRGLVVCVAQPWNARFANNADPRVFRYDGTNYDAMCERLQQAFSRDAGKTESGGAPTYADGYRVGVQPRSFRPL